MDKKLPNLFKNTINKKIDNNEKVYYSNLEIDNPDRTKTKENSKGIIFNNYDSVNIKINKLLNANYYSFNIPVFIETQDKKYETVIIGKMGQVIVTNNNEVIPIYKIKDITLK